MHPSAKRLLDYARQATASNAHPITDFDGVIKRLRISSGRMTNWKARGVSREGALLAEAEFGCSANWILDGTEPSGSKAPLPAHSGAALHVNEPGTIYGHKRDLNDLLAELAAHLEGTDEMARLGVGPLLQRLAANPDQVESISPVISAMLEARPVKKRA